MGGVVSRGIVSVEGDEDRRGLDVGISWHTGLDRGEEKNSQVIAILVKMPLPQSAFGYSTTVPSTRIHPPGDEQDGANHP